MTAELENPPAAPAQSRRIPLRRDWARLIDDLRYVGSTAIQISNELSRMRFCGVDANRLLAGEYVSLRRQSFHMDAAVDSWSHALAAEQYRAGRWDYALRIYNRANDCLLSIQIDGEDARDHFEALVSLYANNSPAGAPAATCRGYIRARTGACSSERGPATAFDTGLVSELLEVLTDNAMPLHVTVEKAGSRHCYEGVLSCFRQVGDDSELFDQGCSLTILNTRIGRACLSEPCVAGAGTQSIQLFDGCYRRALTLALSPGGGATERRKWRKITESLAPTDDGALR